MSFLHHMNILNTPGQGQIADKVVVAQGGFVPSQHIGFEPVNSHRSTSHDLWGLSVKSRAILILDEHFAFVCDLWRGC